MSILTRQEGARLVLDFYNQDEIKRKIAKMLVCHLEI